MNKTKKRLGLAFAGLLVSVSAGCSPLMDSGERVAVAPASEHESTASTAVPEEQISIPVPEPEEEPVVPQAAPLLHKWTSATVVGEALEIPLADLERCHHLHLDLGEVSVSSAEVVCWLSAEYFHVGASVCPSCQKDQLACDGDVLRCTTCRAEFDLLTGLSRSGASSDIRMMSVPFGPTDAALRVNNADIIRAVDFVLSGAEVSVSKAESSVEMESVEVEEEDTRDLPACCR